MRIAFTGKGGTGKTTLVAILATTLARSGRSILAVDLDVNPGLELSLGPLEGDGRLPADAVAEREDGQYGFGLRPELSPAEAVDRYAARGEDGLRFLSLGSIDRAHHDLARTHYAVRAVAAGFDAPGWDVVVDMEAGTKDVYDGTYVAFVDVLAAVTDGSEVATLTCRRLASIAAAQGGPPVGLVVNRAIPNGPAAEEVAGGLDVQLLGLIPLDDQVRRADLLGIPVCDYAPDAAAVIAVRDLAESLRAFTGVVRQ